MKDSGLFSRPASLDQIYAPFDSPLTRQFQPVFQDFRVKQKTRVGQEKNKSLRLSSATEPSADGGRAHAAARLSSDLAAPLLPPASGDRRPASGLPHLARRLPCCSQPRALASGQAPAASTPVPRADRVLAPGRQGRPATASSPRPRRARGSGLGCRSAGRGAELGGQTCPPGSVRLRPVPAWAWL